MNASWGPTPPTLWVAPITVVVQMTGKRRANKPDGPESVEAAMLRWDVEVADNYDVRKRVTVWAGSGTEAAAKALARMGQFNWIVTKMEVA